MGNRDKIIACFKAMDFRPDIRSFEHRLIAQKINCLLQFKGVDTGFSCSLYVRGPYSPDLTKELYDRREDFESLRTGTELAKKEEESVQELKELFGLTPSLLEIGATYAYFTENLRLDPIDALGRVKRLKPFYSEAKIAVGISKTKEYLFRPTEKQMGELRKELKPWEQVSARNLSRD